MQNFSHLATRVLNTPLLLEPHYAQVFFSALAKRLDVIELRDQTGKIETGKKIKVGANSFKAGNKVWNLDGRDPYQTIKGVAVLTIGGTLVHKHGYINSYSGMTGYDGIIARAQHAASNPMVKGILMDFDTPGGEVSGCFDAARSLRKIADDSGKPLWAHCFDMNCSAGMALASTADRRLITNTGIAGSVGVLMAHVSYEDYLEEEGIKVTLIHSGAHKVDGNPYEDLSAEILDKFTSETDALRNDFATLVATLIPGMDVQAVLATEAECYRGQDAVDIGFADEVVNGNDAVDIFVEHLTHPGQLFSIAGETSMKTDEEKKAEAGAQAPAAEGTEQVATAADNAAQAESSASKAEPNAQAEVAASATAEQANSNEAGATGERARVESILDSEEAEGRTDMAKHLAFKTDMSAEEAIALMAASPKQAASFSLGDAMGQVDQPNISGDADGEASETDKQVAAAMGSYNKAKGIKPKS